MTFEVVPTLDRAEWLAARRAGIGASDIAGIMGLSPYTTPFQVWADKVYELPEDHDDDEAMLWGNLLEGLILDEWGRRNWPVEDRRLLLRSTETPYFMATPDGLTDNGTQGAVVEAKVTSDWSWAEPPQHYVLQVQWQLIVTGYRVGYLTALHAARRLATYEIEADPDAQAEMIATAHDFWKLVEANEPPPIDAEDNAVMASLWPTSTERATEIAPETAKDLFMARNARDDGKRRYEAVVASVKALMQDADTAVVDQTVVATWKADARGVRKFLVKGDGLDDD